MKVPYAIALGHSLAYNQVFGLKNENATAPFQMHTHILANHLPGEFTIDGDRVRCAKLETWAASLGLQVHITEVRDPIATATYMANNLAPLENIQLPKHFRRVCYSRNWPKFEYQKRQAIKRCNRETRKVQNETRELSEKRKFAEYKSPFWNWLGMRIRQLKARLTVLEDRKRVLRASLNPNPPSFDTILTILSKHSDRPPGR